MEKKQSKKQSFVLYNDWGESVNMLSDSQAGTLLKAIFAYHNQTDIPQMDGMVTFAFKMFQVQFERDTIKYQERCEQQRKNIEKRWNNTNDTTEYHGKPRNTNYTNHTDNDNDNDNENDNENDYDYDMNICNKAKRTTFCKPTIDEIKAYCNEKGITNVDAQAFFDFYESKGWMVGKNKMKNWRAAVNNWSRHENDYPRQAAKTDYKQNINDRWK